MNFVVVEFLGENSVQAVPITWLTPKKTNVYWPSTRSYTSLKRQLMGDYDFSKGDWTLVSVKVRKYAESYSKAKECEKRAADTSNCESESGMPKRKIMKNTQLFSSESEDEVIDCRNRVPEFPQHNSSSNIQQHYEIVLPNNVAEYITEIPDTLEFSTNSVCCSNKDNDLPGGSPLIASEKNCVKVIDKSATKKKSMTDKEFKDTMITFMASVEYKLSEIKKDINKVNDEIVQLKPEPSQQQPNPCTNLSLPIKNEDDLTAVEGYLNYNENFYLMVKFLSKLGGLTLKDITFKIMEKVFGTEYSRAYSLYGKKGKKSFCNLNLCKVVICTCLNLAESTEAEVKKFIALFLAGSGDRYGGRKERISKICSADDKTVI